MLTMSKKNVAPDVKSGRPRACFIKIEHTKMDWLNGVRNVQMKLPTKHVRND